MDSELKRRVDALRRPLELAAADGFAGVRKVSGLGHALRVACDGVIARLAEAPIAGLDAWRATLGRWEQLDDQQQAVEVARGMRLLARFPRAVASPVKSGPMIALPPLPAATAPPVQLQPQRSAKLQPSTTVTRAARPPSPTATPSPPSSLAVPPKAPLLARPSPPASSTPQPQPQLQPPAPARARPASTRPPARVVPPPAAAAAEARSTARPPMQAVPAGPPAAVAEAHSTPGGAAAAEARSMARPPAGARVDDPIPGGARGRAPGWVQPEAAVRGQPETRPAGAAPEPPTSDPLAQPTTTLPGIGPALADKLAERGLTTVEDLLWLVPRRYDDVRGGVALAEVCAMAEGERATFLARVTSARMIFARGRRWAEVRLAHLEGDAPASALVRWFNVYAGIEKRMPAGCQLALSGVVRKRSGRLELANPDILGIELATGGTGAAGAGPVGPAKPMPAIIARYPDVPGVPPGRLRSACASACARVAGCAEDGVPAAIERAAGMASLAETLAQLHAPPPSTSPADLAAMNAGDSQWQRRLAFGELFALGVAITLRRRDRCGDAAVPCPRAPEVARRLAAALPFALTGAQRRAIDELAGDLARAVPMNRLLQGDVGAGKTAVAFAAALQVAQAGRQTAVMAPTELLAEQHAETWRGWARASGLRLELLTASTPRGVRASLLALLAAGELDVLIGTHALIAESVGFAALGLVVIDEQHRFGVAQRAKLRDKGDGQGAPHLLVMTATPIPRTLALTAYGDLDVSVLDELPPGRQPVTTRVLTGARGVAAAYKLVAEQVAAGERAYIVCPKVAPGDPEEDEPGRAWKDATTVAAEVAAQLPAVRTGLVHGRLDGAARDRVMRAFKTGELDVLVATTVIEVGVDVPAATVMVIHDADRFGLAQLHQLRGRVGRGGGTAHCLLLSQGQAGDDAARRLDAMVATHDGFRIAEQDLALRGPGELLGPKQAGVPRLRFGNLAQHTELLLEARRHAEAVLADDPGLAKPAHAALRRALARRLVHTVYGAEGG